MRFCRVSDAWTKRYQAACGNVHVAFVCCEPETTADSLDADRACHLMRRKRDAFSQSHKCNPERPLLD
jgi:hypothetical protein